MENVSNQLSFENKSIRGNDAQDENKICLLFKKVIWLGTHVSKMPFFVVLVKFIDLFWEEAKHEEKGWKIIIKYSVPIF